MLDSRGEGCIVLIGYYRLLVVRYSNVFAGASTLDWFKKSSRWGSLTSSFAFGRLYAADRFRFSFIGASNHTDLNYWVLSDRATCLLANTISITVIGEARCYLSCTCLLLLTSAPSFASESGLASIRSLLWLLSLTFSVIGAFRWLRRFDLHQSFIGRLEHYLISAALYEDGLLHLVIFNQLHLALLASFILCNGSFAILSSAALPGDTQTIARHLVRGYRCSGWCLRGLPLLKLLLISGHSTIILTHFKIYFDQKLQNR